MKKTVFICALLALAAGRASSYNNVYYSAEDRKYMRIHQDFVSDIPASVTRGSIKTSSAAAIRGYQLSDGRTVCQYLVHRNDQSVPVTGQFDTLSLPFDSGSGFWMSPATGDTLATFTTRGSTQAIPIPDFTVDIALKVVSAEAPAAQKRPVRAAVEVSAYPNPFHPGTVIRLSGLSPDASAKLVIVDVRGRIVRDLSRDLNGSRVVWDAGASAQGLYFAVLKSGGTIVRKKLVLMR